MLKPELLQVVPYPLSKTWIRIGSNCQSKSHEILRTPQYHPELQPIETCWGVVKEPLCDEMRFHHGKVFESI